MFNMSVCHESKVVPHQVLANILPQVNTRHSQKITRKVGAADYETTGVIYPRAKL
jgi:hypothetical protein